MNAPQKPLKNPVEEALNFCLERYGSLTDREAMICADAALVATATTAERLTGKKSDVNR